MQRVIGTLGFDKLEAALKVASRYTDNDASSLTGYIFFEAGDMPNIYTTNLELLYTSKLQGAFFERDIAVNAKCLNEVINKAKKLGYTYKVYFREDSNDKECAVEFYKSDDKKISCVLDTFNTNEFVRFVERCRVEQRLIDIQDKASLKDRIVKALSFNDKKHSDVRLSGVLLDFQPYGIEVVSTDTRILYKGTVKQKNSGEELLIILNSNVSFLARDNFEIRAISHNDKYVCFEGGESTFFILKIVGNYLNYKNVFDKRDEINEAGIMSRGDIDNILKLFSLKDNVKMTNVRAINTRRDKLSINLDACGFSKDFVLRVEHLKKIRDCIDEDKYSLYGQRPYSRLQVYDNSGDNQIVFMPCIA